jgi:hypothetical protein
MDAAAGTAGRNPGPRKETNRNQARDPQGRDPILLFIAGCTFAVRRSESNVCAVDRLEDYAQPENRALVVTNLAAPSTVLRRDLLKFEPGSLLLSGPPGAIPLK